MRPLIRLVHHRHYLTALTLLLADSLGFGGGEGRLGLGVAFLNYLIQQFFQLVQCLEEVGRGMENFRDGTCNPVAYVLCK